jgi:uncharacterized coiled-coil protein SlyX
MKDNIENLVLEHLRAIRAGQDGLVERLDRVESRLTNLEVTTAGLRRDLAHMYGEVIEQNASYDGLRARIDRIERRLEIRDD